MILTDVAGGDHIILNEKYLAMLGPVDDPGSNHAWGQVLYLASPNFFLSSTVEDVEDLLESPITPPAFIEAPFEGYSYGVLTNTSLIVLVKPEDGKATIYLTNGSYVNSTGTVSDVWDLLNP